MAAFAGQSQFVEAAIVADQTEADQIVVVDRTVVVIFADSNR